MDSYPHPAPGVVYRIVDGEAVLVLPEKAQVKVLNEVGSLIWTLVDGSRTVAQIAAEVCARYEVEPVAARTDTLRFLGQMADRGALSLSPEPAEGQGGAPE
jgi:hypothetical protein